MNVKVHTDKCLVSGQDNELVAKIMEGGKVTFFFFFP